MGKRKNPDIDFVNLHSHTTFSTFDGFGFPEDHLEYIWENGMDAYALTDHGHMNALPYQLKAIRKFRDQGKDVKPIYGFEAYFHPSIEKWQEYYNMSKSNDSLDDMSGTIIEDELNKTSLDNRLRERRHLLLLAQNREGLSNIFQLVSKSYTKPYFYYFPRIDYELLEKHSEGVIATNACMGGLFAGDYWNNKRQDITDDDGELVQKDERSEEQIEEDILEAMDHTAKRITDILGDRFYGELQWNAIEEQHVINKYVIETCQKHDIKLVSNADAHYPARDQWQNRELYKQLGWLGKNNPSSLKEEVPQSRDEMDYELYPKNGDQMFADYKRYSKQMGFEYDDEMVKQSIEETYDIAHNRIESFFPNNDVKLPSFAVPDNKTAPEKLRELCEAGLKKRQGGALADDEEARQRMERELEVINRRNFAKYFLTMKQIMDEGQKMMLTGPGRGSGAGSFVNYLLGITQVDPRKYGLLFSRFLRDKPPVGILEEDNDGEEREYIELELENGKDIKLTNDCSVLVTREGTEMWIKASNLKEGDDIVNVDDKEYQYA